MNSDLSTQLLTSDRLLRLLSQLSSLWRAGAAVWACALPCVPVCVNTQACTYRKSISSSGWILHTSALHGDHFHLQLLKKLIIAGDSVCGLPEKSVSRAAGELPWTSVMRPIDSPSAGEDQMTQASVKGVSRVTNALRTDLISVIFSRCIVLHILRNF